jgi:hypothetical protein
MKPDPQLGENETFWDRKEVPAAEGEGELMVFQSDGKGVVMRPETSETSETSKPTVPLQHEKNNEQQKNGKKKMALVGAWADENPPKRSLVIDPVFVPNLER